jgi:type II secretory pathway component PulM
MATLSARLAPPPGLVRWWAGKTPAERRVVGVLALLIVASLGWLAVWRPLQRDVAALRVDVPATRAALAEGERMAAEMAGLARAAPPPPAPDAPAAIERILAAHGLRDGAAKVEWREDRARITIDSVPFAALVEALDALDREARLTVVEATLTARVDPGTVRADVVLAH